VPVGIFNGKSLIRISGNSIIQALQLLWRYGLDLFRMNSFVNRLLKQFATIYGLQKSGKAYANVEDMLTAMGGEQMRDLMKTSAGDYIRNERKWNKRLVDEVITGALRVNYGQSTSVNAFTALTALAGMQEGSLWSVVGGNYKMAECALKDSECSSVDLEDVVSVTKIEEGGTVKYTILTADGKTNAGYDVVIVANPLNVSSVKYNNFSNEVYTAATATPYHRTVASIYKGTINQQFFGQATDSAKFPQAILTTDMQSPPFNFNSVAVLVPSEVTEEEKEKCRASLGDIPERVWKVFSPRPLTRDQCLSLFPETNPDDSVCCDWLAYPQYIAPYRAASFILDEGVFYINAIEMAASAMEMSAIGAKNAALLARDYLLHNTAA
jgi:prenylcysteine oxidase/farnesylcysteine lyase